MGVRIDEPRQDEVGPVVDDCHAVFRLPLDIRERAKRLDGAVFDQQAAVFLVTVGVMIVGRLRLGDKRKKSRADKCRHV
jgi:hypothetical protein